MKILHTSDWHIGKKINGCDLLSEQRAAINEIIEIADRKQASIIAVCGDILERGADGAAEETLINGLIALSGDGRLVLAIAGKSDDTERLKMLKTALGVYNIIIVTGTGEKISTPPQAASGLLPIKVTGGRGFISVSVKNERANIAFLPYVGATDLWGAADFNFDKADANIIMAYVDGDASGIGINAERLPADANYIALGGSHKTQLVDHDRNIYYCGSILPDGFEDFKAKEKNLKKVIVADVTPSGVTKTVERLTKGKSLVKVTSSSVEQALFNLRGLPNDLIELDLNLSHALSLSEYNAIKNSSPDIVRINLKIPEQLSQNKIGILKSGGVVAAFKNFYSCVFGHPPSKELSGLFGQITEYTEYCIDAAAPLVAADLRAIFTLDKKARSKYAARIFNADEYQKNIVRDILKFQEDIQNQNDEKIAKIDAELDRYSDIDTEISVLGQKRLRTLEAKKIMPLFEKTLEYAKEIKAVREKLADLDADRARFLEQTSLYDVETPRAEYERAAETLAVKKAELNIRDDQGGLLNEENGLKARLAALGREFNESYENLRHYEKEIVNCERIIAEQTKFLENRVAPETTDALGKAAIYEEILKTYSAEGLAVENKIKTGAAARDESEKKLAALVAKHNEALAQVGIFEKNIAELSGEAEVANVLPRLEAQYKNGRELVESIKGINAAIKEQIAANDAASEDIREIIDQIDETAKLKRQQTEQIAEYEERLEKFNHERGEHLGVNIFAKIGNDAKIGEPCPLCNEIVRNKPNFKEVSTAEFDREIDNINERLREAYSRRDTLAAELLLKERLREDNKNKLAGIVEELRRLKTEKHRLILSSGGDDERAIAENALLFGQRVLRAKNELKTLETLRARLNESERDAAAENGNFNFYKKSEETLRSLQEEIGGRVADVSFSYFQIKKMLGKDLKKLEQELQTQNKRREDAVQNILAEENRKMLLLNKLRRYERTVCETEARQIALEERLKALNGLKSAKIKKDDTRLEVEIADLTKRLKSKRESLREAEEGLYSAAAALRLIEKEAKGLAAKSENIAVLLNRHKTDGINAMLSGGFKNAAELKNALADEISTENALNGLAQAKAKIKRLSAERERLLVPDERTQHTLALTKTLYELFCSDKLIDLTAEEYLSEKARRASKKLNELSGGRYNITYEDGFATVDNFASGIKKRIAELSGEIEKAFS
jgi:exonuclease SbcD